MANNTKKIRTNEAIEGTLAVTGASTLAAGVTVIGVSQLTGNTTVTGNLNVTGTTSFGSGSTFNASTFDVHDDTDPTKQIKFDLVDATTATTTTIKSAATTSVEITLPDADSILVGTDGVQTITDKNISAADNVITDITNTSIATNAAIAVNKLAAAPGPSYRLASTTAGSPLWTKDDFKPEAAISMYDDWIGTGAGALGWTDTSALGGVAETGILGDVIHQGTLVLNTGIDVAGAARRVLGASPAGALASGFSMASGTTEIDFTFLVCMEQASIAPDEFVASFGLGDNPSGNDVNYVGFLYTTGGGNFTALTQNVGGTNSFDTGVPALPGVWYKMRVATSSLAANYDFYIDDVLVGNSNTFTPSDFVAPKASLVKTTGTNPVYAYVDYFKVLMNIVR